MMSLDKRGRWSVTINRCPSAVRNARVRCCVPESQIQKLEQQHGAPQEYHTALDGVYINCNCVCADTMRGNNSDLHRFACDAGAVVFVAISPCSINMHLQDHFEVSEHFGSTELHFHFYFDSNL